MTVETMNDYRARCRKLSDDWADARMANDPDFLNKLNAAQDDEERKMMVAINRATLDFKEPTAKIAHGDRWGRFQYDREVLVLRHDQYKYEIDLERCNTPAQMLDWIFQISAKGWMTQQDKGDLLDALDDLLYPQKNLCSFGQNLKLNASEYLLKNTTEKIEVYKWKAEAA